MRSNRSPATISHFSPSPTLEVVLPPQSAPSSSTPKIPWRAVALWTTLVAVLVVINERTLFREPICETYDYAANALQIRTAKEFREIEGNYSRWKFHHPGPAFFYAYAVGEAVFYDWLRWTASPHAAHVLVGLMFQSACLVAALEIAARRIANPWFFPVASAAALTHFCVVRAVGECVPLVGIWPPQVLIGPLLLYLVCLADFLAGNRWSLPASIFAGCMLVHSHVAQGLLVVPLFLATALAYFGVRRSMAGGLVGPLAASAGILAVFLLPLALEVASRPSDNNVLRYIFFRPPDPERNWPAGISYLTTFLAYRLQPDGILDDEWALVIWRRIWLDLGVWLLGAALIAWQLFGPPSRRLASSSTIADHADGDLRFWRSLALLLAAALAITLVWSRQVAGEYWYFNTYFAYALTLIYLLLLLACVFRRLPPAGESRFPGVVAALLPAALLLVPQLWSMELADNRNAEIHEQIASVLQRHPPPSSGPVVMRFEHKDWGVALATALELQRAGVDVRVGEKWEWKFSRRFLHRPEDGAPAYFWIISGDEHDLKAAANPQVMERAVLIRTSEPTDEATQKKWEPI